MNQKPLRGNAGDERNWSLELWFFGIAVIAVIGAGAVGRLMWLKLMEGAL